MEMNKKYILLLCLFFIFSNIWSQEDDAVFRHPLTQQSLITFNSICARLATQPIIKGNFTQEKTLSRFGRSLVSSGNFIIAAEYGMVWETLQPFPSTMIMGNDFMLQSRPGGQTSILSAQGNETFIQMADILSSVFSGRSQGLLENFEVFFSGSVSNWSIGLLPRDSIIASFAARIIMSGDSAIRAIRIFEQNGDIISYTLLNHSFPRELNTNEKAFFTIP